MSTGLSNSVIIFLVLLAPNIGFVLQDTPVIYGSDRDEDSGYLNIDLEITDDDYDIVDLEEMENTTENSTLSRDIHRNTNEENTEPKLRSSEARNISDKRSKAKIVNSEQLTIKKREVMQGREKDVMCVQYNETRNVFECNNPNSGLLKNKLASFNVIDSIRKYFSCDNCTPEDNKGIGIRAIRCLLADYRQNRQPYDILTTRLRNIIIIWLVVYLVIAIPLWCTKGWCCCCLYCKFFKPQETIQEAKKYLLLNPPGVLITKKGAIINYEPTEREKDCYEEFGHFIRTL